MLTKNEIKRIQLLKQKKKRQQLGLFVAEGEKLVNHLLQLGIELDALYCTSEGFHDSSTLLSEKEMKQITLLKNPSTVLGVFNQFEPSSAAFSSEFVLVLDGLQDPGNMGTILRLCDWFGIKQCICTPQCVDVYNEKVVQASMGSIANVDVFEMEADEIVALTRENGFVLTATKMDAPNIYNKSFKAKTALIIGNEGKGVSKKLLNASSAFISIPNAKTSKAESLNAAMATSILLSEYFRNT